MKKACLVGLCLTCLSFLNLSCEIREREELKSATLTIVAGSKKNAKGYITFVPKDKEDIYPTEYMTIRDPALCSEYKKMLEEKFKNNVIYDSSIPTKDGKEPDFRKIFEEANRDWWDSIRAKYREK